MSLLEMKIDRTVPVPLHYQLKSLILSEIESGNLKKEIACQQRCK